MTLCFKEFDIFQSHSVVIYVGISLEREGDMCVCVVDGEPLYNFDSVDFIGIGH